jgi:CCR4-NOT transcription complex subunit 1
VLLEQFPHIQRYPERERRITGLLFGEYISKLLHNERLALALRCVLESLQSEPNGGMFRFGVLALQQFVQRLPQLPPHYVTQLLTLPALSQQQPELVLQIRDVVNNAAAGGSSTTSSNSGNTSGRGGNNSGSSSAGPPATGPA